MRDQYGNWEPVRDLYFGAYTAKMQRQQFDKIEWL